MKVEQRTKVKYEPITITLETKEEAEFMWHLLNCPEGQCMTEYCKSRRYKMPTKYNFWALFDRVLKEDC